MIKLRSRSDAAPQSNAAGAFSVRRWIIALISVGVAATVGCVERDRTETPLPTSVQANMADDRSGSRPDFLVGTWRWYWSNTGERHSLVLRRDGRAARITDSKKSRGTWHVRDDGILAILLIPKTYRIDSNSNLVDIEKASTDREGVWQKAGSVSFPDDDAESRLDRPPRSRVGTWRWPHQYNELSLYRDGRAVKEMDASVSIGTWRIRDDGMVAISVTMEFRIDSKSELIDVGTLSTAHDFPWFKADANRGGRGRSPQ